MRTRIGLMILVVGLSAPSSHAGIFGGKSKPPEAIDSPIVRPKLKETHKMGASTLKMDRDKFGAASWGARWDLLFKETTRPLAPHLRD
jgi:hypothetical protein